MRAGLVQRAQQEMLLQPRMLQAIEVLGLPSVELAGYLRDAFEGNEALTLEEPPRSQDAPPRTTSRGREATDRHDAWLAETPARDGGVEELVEEQLALLDLAPEIAAWVRFLAGSLDEHGYLSAADEDLLAEAREEGLDPELFATAISVLQSLEPRGIGGRDAVEALLLQLDPDHPDYGLLARLVEEFLDELARNKLPGVARSLGLEIDELKGLLTELRELDPRPAASAVSQAAPPIHPELAVSWTGAGFELQVDRGEVPVVGIDEGVRELARDRETPPEVREYLRGKLEQARWLVDAVGQRSETLQKVALATFDRQRPFLEHGPGHLVPLRMGEVADAVGVHLSTVSRAVAGVHVQTPWGVLPLRHFFQASAGEARDSARTDVRDEVRRVVEAEDKARPLSDDEITEEMERRGFRLARRTVAKYRRELGIESSYRRREY